MSAVEELKAKHAKELAEAELKDRISAQLPDIGTKRSLHIYDLYGRCAGVDYGDSFRSYSEKAPAPTWEHVIQLAEALPAIPLVKLKDGFTSIVSRRWFDSLPEEKKDRYTEETDLAPFILEWIPEHGPRLKLEWKTILPSGEEIGVGVIFAGWLDPRIGKYTARRVEYLGGVRYKDCRLSPNVENLLTIHRDGEPLCQLESPITWAAGSPEYQNRSTLYWVPIGDTMATPADLARAIIAAKK